ncbi:FkbM family methyltransferase [Arcobacter sp. LA11]|uniref:FkbM family methyltransferase n=1 Tax=Arcobacter sp. LA11 TaxID=1898176 RepID=UPI000934D111|nr:FkbM family methyltransferase [Arcobacter sp. LA11]
MNKNFNKLVEAKNGLCLYNINDQYIGHSIEKYGEFSELEVELFKQICRDNDTVVEVGANIGTHTQVFSKLVGEKGKVLAFEPQRIVFQTLNANIALNSMTNVFTYQNALGSKSSTLFIPPINYEKSGNFGGISIDKFKDGEPIKQLKLDSFIDEVKNLKLIKIDVEGMESDVIKGSKKTIEKFKPFLYVENDRQEKSKELIELIQSLDYKIYWHLPRLFNEDNYFKNKTNIFGNIVSVNMLCIHNNIDIKVNKMIEVTDSNYHPMKRDKNDEK